MKKLYKCFLLRRTRSARRSNKKMDFYELQNKVTGLAVEIHNESGQGLLDNT